MENKNKKNVEHHYAGPHRLNTLHKKWSFPSWISSVNETKDEENRGFGLITEEILNGKLNFLWSNISSPLHEQEDRDQHQAYLESHFQYTI